MVGLLTCLSLAASCGHEATLMRALSKCQPVFLRTIGKIHIDIFTPIAIMGAMKLRSYLTHAGIPKFAESIGETKRAVTGWFYGQRRPSIEVMLKIEAATGGAVKPADWASQKIAA